MDYRETTSLDPREQLLHVKEAARYLALSRSTIYALMDSGQLAYVKINKARRIPASAVLALVETGRVGH